jgi:hypothetical protein
LFLTQHFYPLSNFPSLNFCYRVRKCLTLFVSWTISLHFYLFITWFLFDFFLSAFFAILTSLFCIYFYIFHTLIFFFHVLLPCYINFLGFIFYTSSVYCPISLWLQAA